MEEEILCAQERNTVLLEVAGNLSQLHLNNDVEGPSSSLEMQTSSSTIYLFALSARPQKRKDNPAHQAKTILTWIISSAAQSILSGQTHFPTLPIRGTSMHFFSSAA